MSFAGMNDRDNFSNENKTNSLSSSYGYSYAKRQKNVYMPSSAKVIVDFYTLHKNGYPEQYIGEFTSVTKKCISTVRKKKRETGHFFYYELIKNEIDPYIDRLFEISAKAYGLERFVEEPFYRRMIVDFCLFPGSKAYKSIEDFFCSKCEAINSLCDDDKAFYLSIDCNIAQLETEINNKSEL